MKQTAKGEYGLPPGDFPVTREDFGMAPEDQPVVPDYVMPGEYPKEEESAKKKDGVVQRILFALAAAGVLLISPLGFALGSAKAENEPAAEEISAPDGTPAPTEAPAPDGEPAPEEGPFDENEPHLVFVYALRDAGGIVEYAYYPYVGSEDLFPVTVDTAVRDAAGNTVSREGDPETWLMFRSAGFDYTVDASSLAPDGLTLLLTMHYTKDGEEISRTFTRKIMDKPQDLTAEISLTAEALPNRDSSFHYRCILTPAPGETAEYDPEIIEFTLFYYDAAGERIFGIGNITQDRTLAVEPLASGGYIVDFDGIEPAEIRPENAVGFTIYMELRDNATGYYPYIYESEMAPIEEPYIEPEIDPVLICFSSSVEGSIFIPGNAEAVTSCTYELWEPVTDTLIREADVTEEAKTGRVILEPYELGDFYFDHQAEFDAAGTWPEEAEIRVSMTYKTREGQSVTVTRTQRSSYELGFGIRYVPSTEDVSPEDYEWRGMPGHFKIGFYESEIEADVLADMEEEYVTGNMVSLSMSVDGEEIPITEYSSMRSEEEFTDENGETRTWYYITVFLAPPEKYPEGEGHVATISVTQYLTGYGRAYTTERVIEY